MVINTLLIRIRGVPPYIFFALLGIFINCGIFLVLLAIRKRKIKYFALFIMVVGIFAFAGAKVFAMMWNLLICIFRHEKVTIYTFLNSGLVFYGGLCGTLFSTWLLSKRWDLEYKKDVLDSVAVVVPGFHVWGRLGCFFAGCCYGIAYKCPISVIYINKVGGDILTVSRLPIQLIESAANICIFVTLLVMFVKKSHRGNLLKLYLIIYPSIRFILEFFRGDWPRDVLFGVSMSQVISVTIIGVIVIYTIKQKNNNGGIYNGRFI